MRGKGIDGEGERTTPRVSMEGGINGRGTKLPSKELLTRVKRRLFLSSRARREGERGEDGFDDTNGSLTLWR